MNSSRDISHRARVVGISAEFTELEIVSESACSACHAKALCSMSESKKKTVTVPSSGWKGLEVGDEVEVLLSPSMGYKAVWLAYVVPLLILVAVVVALSECGTGELCTGLSAIGSIGLYYFMIWLFRDKLKNQYEFKIRR